MTKEDEGGGERANGSRKKVFRCSLARIDFLLPLPLPQLLPPLAREFYPTRVPCITLMSGHGVNARGGRERKRIPFSCVHRVRERERKIAKRIARHFCSFPQKVIKRLARGVAVQSFRVYRRKKKKGGGVDLGKKKLFERSSSFSFSTMISKFGRMDRDEIIRSSFHLVPFLPKIVRLNGRASRA